MTIKIIQNNDKKKRKGKERTFAIIKIEHGFNSVFGLQESH